MLGLPFAPTSGATDAGTPVEPLAADHLRQAFEARYNFDLVEVVKLTVHGRSGTMSRTVEMAIKRVDGQLRSVGFFTEPLYLRGTRLLMIENLDREDDFFVYLPSQKKVRRVSTAQRSAAFMGTDLNYEDMERRYAEDYLVKSKSDSMIEGESVFVVHAIPQYDSSYASLDFYISQLDHAILEVRYFRKGSDEPCKVQKVPRAMILKRDGFLIPTRIEVEDFRRRSVTTVEFEDIRVNPKISDSLFSTVALESGRDIPFANQAVKIETPL
jgi:hypothetical protein